MQKKQNRPYYTNRHSCFLLSYHLVLVTKYRKPVLTDGIRDTVFRTIGNILNERNCILLEINGEPDHLHVLFDAPPEINLLDLVRVIKTKTSRFSRRDYPDILNNYYRKPYFWSDSYFIGSVGLNTKDIVTDYIRNQ